MSHSDEDAPLIYGLEFQARALVAEKAPSEVTRFMIGSQTLKISSNQVHIIELDDETGALYSKVLSHPAGEIWHLDWSPFDNTVFASTYQSLYGEDELFRAASLWKIDGGNISESATIKSDSETGEIKMLAFHPTDQTKVVCASENRLHVIDIKDGMKRVASLSGSVKDGGFGVARWAPEEKVSELVVTQGTSLVVWDTRHNAPAWKAENCHKYLVRDADINRNRVNVVATGGDDGALRFWDRRGEKKPLAEFTPHRHWITGVRVNATHDQLVVTSGTDCQVVLSCCSRCASEPVLSASADLGDSTIKSYRHHEDSVVAIEWSAVDPWTFASLSNDGRLLTTAVPNTHKYAILGI